jgi:hypothetical protein
MGCIQGGEPSWTLQDRSYLVSEAVRMADIATDAKVASFQYPDLMGWEPPSTHGDAVGTTGKTLWLAGLGKAEPVGEVWAGADAGWQWLQLEFGQTVLAKRRLTPRGLSKADLPAEPVRVSSNRSRSRSSEEPTLFSGANQPANQGSVSQSEQSVSSAAMDTKRSIDDLAGWVIAESFRPEVVGEALLLAAQGPNAIDRSIALAAVIAKAIDARRRRSTK